MKIVIIGPAYPTRGGNALFVAHLYEALSTTHDVHVISFSRLYPQLIFPGVRQTDISTIAVKKHPANRIIDCLNPYTWWKAARLAESMHPDLLVITWWNPFFGVIIKTIASIFKRRTKRPVLMVTENVVSHEARRIDLMLTKMALRTADYFLVLSEVVEKEIRKLYPGKMVFRSTLPIYDCYQSQEQLTQDQAKQRLGLDGKIVLLFFGYVRQYKGLMNLIEVLPHIQRHIPQVHLLIVGEFYDNRQPYDDALQRLRLETAVTIINKYVANETVHLYFTAANLVVLPYNEATQSGILSIAYGFLKPVVVTNVGGLSELVDDGVTGYIVPPHDSIKLAETIIRYIQNNQESAFSKNIEEKKKKNSFLTIRNVFEEILRECSQR